MLGGDWNFNTPIDPSSAFGNWTSSGPPVAYTRSWTGSSTPVTIRFTGPSSYSGDVAADPIRVTVNDTSAGTPALNVGTVKVRSDNWWVKCQAAFNGTAQMTNGNTKIVVTLGSQTTSGQLIQPRPISPTQEDC